MNKKLKVHNLDGTKEDSHAASVEPKLMSPCWFLITPTSRSQVLSCDFGPGPAPVWGILQTLGGHPFRHLPLPLVKLHHAENGTNTIRPIHRCQQRELQQQVIVQVERHDPSDGLAPLITTYMLGAAKNFGCQLLISMLALTGLICDCIIPGIVVVGPYSISITHTHTQQHTHTHTHLYQSVFFIVLYQ